MGFFDRPTTRILRRREWIPSGKAGSRNEGGNNGNGGGNNGGGGNPSPPGGGGPKLTSPTGTTTGATTADLSVTTNRGNGTLYWVVTISSTAPTKAQVKAGQNEAGAAAPDSGSQAVSASGAQAITGGATGLSADTAYFAHFMHEAANGSQSTVATSATFTTDAAATTPLDGLSNITGAYSFSRDLLASFSGGTRYSDSSGAITSWGDQSGNSRNMTDASQAAQRPTLSTAGPNSKACADFNGTTNWLTSGATDPLSDFIAAGAGYIVISFIADVIDANDVQVYVNEGVIADAGQFMGLFTKTGDALHIYNWDGGIDTTSTSVTEGTAYVAEWRHDTGNLILRVNAGTAQSVASGNTTTLTGQLRVGAGGGATPAAARLLDGKVFELVTFNVVPDEATRDALVADMMDWIGAA